jgi:RNA polymerase sigma-70 factor (ECF subfamily)
MAPEELAEFHRGTPAALERCYREHFGDVRRAVGRILRGADEEATVHQVFYRLISDANLRQGFRGGNFAAWVTTVAKNEAIDCRRRRELEQKHLGEQTARSREPVADPDADAKLLVARFVEEKLPKEMRPLFEARFLRQLSQREAADELGIARTTLAYQEQQIRELLRSYLIGRGRR